MMSAMSKVAAQKPDTYAEGARMLQFLRALGSEDQRIAYAVLEGMRLQKRMDDAEHGTNKLRQKETHSW